MTSYRLATGGLINRQKPLAFSFDGRRMLGFEGDSPASGLLANGQLLVGRSFKYHRPRGILTAGAAEPNALMTIGQGGLTEPNTRATMQELYQGLESQSQSRWPSLESDVGALNRLFSPFLGAGFYYKTFMWPASFWERIYEPLIRKAAGLGKASYEADPDSYDKRWAHCDLLVIGSGPAGLAAALSAGRSGARVILMDEHSATGGSLLSETATIGGAQASQFVAETVAELESLSNVQILTRTTVFGWYDGNVFGAIERVQKHVRDPLPAVPVERLWRIVSKRALLASGAEERPLVFGGNDIPGVMMATAMRTYLNRYGVAPGKQVAIFTTNDSGYALARDLESAGVDLVAVIDSRADTVFRYSGRARVIKGAYVSDAYGGKALSSISVWKNGSVEMLEADALAMSGGFSPIIRLACHRGAKPIWSDEHAGFLAPTSVNGFDLAGAVNTSSGIATCLAEGAARGAASVEGLGFAASVATFATVEGDIVAPPAKPVWNIPRIKGKAFIDYQNDVHSKDLRLAVQEGYGHVELAKRYTTNGMATDQGKLSNVNAIGLLAEARGLSPAEIGATTFRPFYTPYHSAR